MRARLVFTVVLPVLTATVPVILIVGATPWWLVAIGFLPMIPLFGMIADWWEL